MGVVSSAVLAKLGHVVIGLDVDEVKISQLNRGAVPFYEPDLTDLVQAGLKTQHLAYTTQYEAAIPKAEVILIAVGTPSAPNGTADLRYVFGAVAAAAEYMADKVIVAIKSTVPPGTNVKIRDIISKYTDKQVYVAALPEFLREGNAVADTLKPDRIVIGATEPAVIKRLLSLHEGLGGKRVVITPESAQMAKYTANAYLAQRITFINQIANICEKNGAKISQVIEAIGDDKRIGGHYWYPGLGYGGSCFPKDVKELSAYAKSIGEGQGLLPKIDELNEERIIKKMNEYNKLVEGFKGKKVAVLGLSFKPNTNDTRFAPALVVVPFLLRHGAFVTAYDPQVKDEAIRLYPGIALADDPYKASSEAQVLILLVEWPELINLDVHKLAEVMDSGAFFIDTRNQYTQVDMKNAGLKYVGIGNG